MGVAPSFSSEETLLLVQLGLVGVVGRFEVASGELNNTHNDLMMWKHFGGDERLVRVSPFTLSLGTCLNWA